MEITLDKRIPIAAGLGGGSSDAATTLLVLNRVWQLHCPQVTLHHLAAQLGSDVPFFLEGPTALACGRGEVLSPISSPSPLAGILLNPGFGVSAGWAYRQFNGQSLATDLTIPSILQALDRRDLTGLADVMVNDLEPGVAMAYPVIRQVQEALRLGRGIGYLHVGEWADRRRHLPTRCRPLHQRSPSLRMHSAWAVIPFTTLSAELPS